jgi:hypothetical protein
MSKADVHFPWLTPHKSAGAVNIKNITDTQYNKQPREESWEHSNESSYYIQCMELLATSAKIFIIFKHII